MWTFPVNLDLRSTAYTQLANEDVHFFRFYSGCIGKLARVKGEHRAHLMRTARGPFCTGVSLELTH